MGPQPVELHGSGTTNPSKAIWAAIEQLTARANPEVHITYRAVGSGTGQKEFGGWSNTPPNTPYTMFGSGDIPFSKEDFDTMKAAGREPLQVPFVIGAVSFFHSLPGLQSGLNMTSCLLADIFSTRITKWDHPDVAAINPELAGSAYAGQDIFVVRRELGSSSTSAITEYLHLGCPAKWPANKVGKTITWPSSTNGAQGSDGISNFLNDNPGSIGYVDVGHGHKKNLKEIELKNAHGVYLDSKTADLGAAMEEALKEGLLPPSLDESVHNVKLLNLRGARTWPIVGVSYLYLQKDLTALGQSGALLEAFVEHMLSDEVQGTAEAPGLISEFGFAPVPSAVMDLNRRALAMMKLAPGVKEWTTEYADNTLVGAGALEYVMSAKRQSYSLYERKSLKSSLDDNWAAMNADKATRAGEAGAAKTPTPVLDNAALTERVNSLEDQNVILWTALGLSIASTVASALLAVLYALKGNSAGKYAAQDDLATSWKESA